MENKFKLTQAGYNALKEELAQLNEARKLNIEALKEARAQGDLSENADYDAARNDQAKIEARLKDIDNILKNSEIIEETSGGNNRANIGKMVKLKFMDTEKIQEYYIAGTIEADPLNGVISNESPVGKAIIGKRKNDVVTVKTENKEFDVQIIEIRNKDTK